MRISHNGDPAAGLDYTDTNRKEFEKNNDGNAATLGKRDGEKKNWDE